MSLTQFTSITGTCVPVPGPDMDTDRIIPARFLKCITFDELAGVMFWDERFSSLLEEVNSFQESLATQSRKSNL